MMGECIMKKCGLYFVRCFLSRRWHVPLKNVDVIINNLEREIEQVGSGKYML